MKNFIKHTGHLYTVKNQTGFNNALYDCFKDTLGWGYTKKEIRDMVQSFPQQYPSGIVIIDKTLECDRIDI